MECKKIYKYLIIEAYPSIIKHNIPIVGIFLFIVYVLSMLVYFIYLFFKNLRRGFKNVMFFLGGFFKPKNVSIKSNSSSFNVNISSTSSENMEVSTFEDLKKHIVKTDIEYFKKEEAISVIKELIDKGVVEDKSTLPVNGFLLKKETIYLKSNFNQFQEGEEFLLKGFNYPAMFTYKVYKAIFVDPINKIKSKFKKEN